MTTRPRIVLAATAAATAICTLVVTSASVADAADAAGTNCTVPATTTSAAATPAAATSSTAKPATTTSGATSATANSPSPLTAASTRVLVGETSGSTFPQDIDSYTSTVGTTPDIVMWYVNWNSQILWPKQQAGIDARNVTPEITWSPDDSSFSMTALVNGDYDPYLQAQAAMVKAWNRPVMIRPLHEMNGNWQVYGTTKVTPAQYVAGWRHLVNVFRKAGVTNVKWIWSPNTYGFGATVPFDSYYPGNDWVDWVGLDGYNSNRWNRSFATIYQQSYDDITALTSKPLMVAEWGDPGRNTDKAAWITDAFYTVKTWMPKIRAITTFDRAKEEDWRVNSSADTLSAYQAAIANLNSNT